MLKFLIFIELYLFIDLISAVSFTGHFFDPLSDIEYDKFISNVSVEANLADPMMENSFRPVKHEGIMLEEHDMSGDSSGEEFTTDMEPIDDLITKEVLLDYDSITVPPSCINYTRPSAISPTDDNSNHTNTSTSSTPKKTTSIFSDANLPDPGDIPLLNRKIYNAHTVSINEHPYMVSVRRNYSHYLSGALVSTNMVITVGHPVYMVPIYELAAVVGETYNDRGRSLEVVIFIHFHPNFDQHMLSHNFALLRLYANVKMSFSHKFVNLSGAPHGGTGFVSGWGRCDGLGKTYCLPRGSSLYPGERADTALKRITIPRSMFHQCHRYWDIGVPVERTCFCAGAARADYAHAPCLGVPGAPLVVNSTLVGLLSHGLSCGYQSDLPLIYVDIPKHYGWLKEIIKSMNVLDGEKVFRSFFIATKAYITKVILGKVRRSVPSYRLTPQPIVPVVADGFLIKLDAITYDIRDFIEGGMYRKSKEEIYKRFRKLDVTHQPRVAYDSDRETHDELPMKGLGPQESWIRIKMGESAMQRCGKGDPQKMMELTIKDEPHH